MLAAAEIAILENTVQLVQADYCSLVKVKVTMQHSDIISPIENRENKSANQDYEESARCRALKKHETGR